MKKIIHYIFIFFLSTLMHAHDAKIQPQKSAVTYEFNGGRLGDNLHTYCLALWISYLHNIPLLYKPFAFSDQLKLHHAENIFNKDNAHRYKKIEALTEKNAASIDPEAGILYTCSWQSKIKVNYQDEHFLNIIKNLIAPTVPIPVIDHDKNKIGIAMHIRTGGSYEHFAQGVEILRFPPLSYYLDQIKIIYVLLNRPLFIHLFTDDEHPEKLAHKIHQHLGDRDIEIFYRKKDNTHNANVIEDFFMMTQYECLIRPNSHYSIWIQRLGNHKLITIPAHAAIINEKWSIDKFSIINQFGSLL